MAANPIDPSGQDDLTDQQALYAAQVINLINIASQIRAGHAEQVASSIEAALPNYLREIETHAPNPYKTVALYGTALLYKSIAMAIPPDLQASVSASAAAISQVLSDDCFKSILPCSWSKSCVPWPTSLLPVDVNTKDPMGFRYIVNSHCGFAWPKFWRPNCGPPMGLVACTGETTLAAVASRAAEEPLVLNKTIVEPAAGVAINEPAIIEHKPVG